jgi:hypothetical protein
MKYSLDHYILNELSGYIRLLFESGSSYFYVWLNQKYELRGIQFIFENKEAVIFTVDKNIIDGEITRIPFNRAIACKINEKIDENRINWINSIQNDELPNLIGDIKRLLRNSNNVYVLNLIEEEYIKKLPQSKKY